MKKTPSVLALSVALIFTVVVLPATISAQAKRGVAIPSDQLPEKMGTLDIKDYFIASKLKRAGIIHSLSGTVIVIHKATNEAFFGQEGDYLYENNAIETIADSRCRLRLINEDVVILAQNTHLELDWFSMDRKKKGKRLFLGMLTRKAMFYALRLFSFKQASTRLRTPTAVAGVR